MKNRPKEISNHKEFINLLNDNGLTQLVTKPTRLQNTLDLMITNNCELDISPTTNKPIKGSIPLLTERQIGNC